MPTFNAVPASTTILATPLLAQLPAQLPAPIPTQRPAPIPLPLSSRLSRQPESGPGPAAADGFLDINPDAMSGAAHRLRGLAAGGPGALPAAPEFMGPDVLQAEAGAATVPGVGRFLAAVGAATSAHSSRITELAAYAGAAASALDWMAGAVSGTDGLSSSAMDGMMPA